MISSTETKARPNFIKSYYTMNIALIDEVLELVRINSISSCLHVNLCKSSWIRFLLGPENVHRKVNQDLRP